jgi:hypothetical protein
MQLHWSEEAIDDVEVSRIIGFRRCRTTAPELVRAIYSDPTALLQFPIAGGTAKDGSEHPSRDVIEADTPNPVIECRRPPLP